MSRPPPSRTPPRDCPISSFPCSSLLFSLSSRASFSSFQKISDGQSEARVAGACSWWCSLSLPYNIPARCHLPPPPAFFLSFTHPPPPRSNFLVGDQGQLTPDTRGSLLGPRSAVLPGRLAGSVSAEGSRRFGDGGMPTVPLRAKPHSTFWGTGESSVRGLWGQPLCS